MDRIYIYPKNLKEKANLWLWQLRDFAFLSIMLILSVLLLAKTGTVFPLGLCFVFAFLTIRLSECSVLDYLTWCMRFFVTGQQEYFWR